MTDASPPDDGVPALGTLVEALTADRASVASLARVLTGVLADALPPEVVQVDYQRTMSDRLHGRQGEAVGLRVGLGDATLTIAQRGGQVDAEIANTVRGVVLSRHKMTVTEWITALVEGMRAIAEQDAAAREALQRLLLG
jgi:hypothetical protein